MTTTPNEHPATAECPQCGHEVETTLHVYRDGSGAYVYGRHCPECDEAVAIDVSFTLSGAVRWNALRAWLTGERIALESQMRRMPPDPARSSHVCAGEWTRSSWPCSGWTTWRRPSQPA